MKSQASANHSKTLVLLIGLVAAAVLAMAVVWSILSRPGRSNTHRAPAATHMKVPKIPAAPRLKIPQSSAVAQSTPAETPIPPQLVDTDIKSPAAARNQVDTATPQTGSSSALSSSAALKTSVQEEVAPGIGGTADTAEPKSARNDESLKDTAMIESAAKAAPHEAPAETSEPISHIINEPMDGGMSREATADKPKPDAPVEETVAGVPATAERLENARSDEAPVATESEPSLPVSDQSSPKDETPAALFNLQLGAYRVEAYANEAVAKISEKGYNAFIVEINDSRQNTWYTVRIGHYHTRAEADTSLERFKQEESIDAIVARSGKL